MKKYLTICGCVALACALIPGILVAIPAVERSRSGITLMLILLGAVYPVLSGVLGFLSARWHMPIYLAVLPVAAGYLLITLVFGVVSIGSVQSALLYALLGGVGYIIGRAYTIYKQRKAPKK